MREPGSQARHPAGLGIGYAEDRSGDEPDPRPMVVTVPLPSGLGILGALADPVHAQADERKAAQLALHTQRKAWQAQPAEPITAEALQQAMDQCNDLVRRVAAQAAGPQPAQLSLTMLALRGRGLLWATAGDNRLFLLRDGELAALIEPGFPPAPPSASYLGMEQPPELDLTRKPLAVRAGDRLLLCSSAIATQLRPEQIRATLRFDAQTAANELVALAAPAFPGRGRALVVALPAPPRAATPTAEAPKPGFFRTAAPPSQPFGVRLLRDPIWLAALLMGLLAAGLLTAALVLQLRAQAPAAQAPAEAQAAVPVQEPAAPNEPIVAPAPAKPAEISPISESPERPLQYRDLHSTRN